MEDSVIDIWRAHFILPGYAKELLVATFLGLLLGFEREWRNKAASLRTFAVICAGSCLFTLLSVNATLSSGTDTYDITRIAAQIVTGIGFVGGGVIFKTTDRIEGVTTAALIWFAAALGMACGFGRVDMALWGFICYALIYIVSYGLYRLIILLRGPEEALIKPTGKTAPG